MHRTSLQPRKRSRALLASMCLGSLLSALTFGCGGGPTPTDPSRAGTQGLLTLLPADANGVVMADVRTLRGASFVARLDEVMGPLMDERGREMRALLDRVDEVAIAYHHGRTEVGDESLVVVARGSFSDQDLNTLGRDHTPATHRAHALRHDNSMSVALAGNHTLAFGNEPLVLAVLDRLDGVAPATGPTRPVVLDAARRIELGQHTITYAAEVSERFRAELAREQSARGGAVAAGARVDVSTSVVAHGFGLFSDADMAREMAAEILGKLAEASEDPQAAEMGMLEIINALHVRADGPLVTADISLNHEAVNRIVSIVLLGVQAGAAFAEPVVEPDEPQPENQTEQQGPVEPREDLNP